MTEDKIGLVVSRVTPHNAEVARKDSQALE
jgi:hypothetical protein